VKVLLHGEVNFFEIKELPKGLKKVDIKQDYFIVGESETHGNDHRVAVKDKLQVEFYEDSEGRLFMKNLSPTQVYCPKVGRHDTKTIPDSVWEIDKAKEYDHISKRLVDVRD